MNPCPQEPWNDDVHDPRRATGEDFPRLLGITHRALREIATQHYSAQAVDQAIQEGAWTLKRSLVEHGHFFVAERNGVVEGGIGWDMASLGEAEEDVKTLAGTASLRGLYVNPDATGHGIGTALLKSCMDDIRLAGHPHIELFASFVAKSLFARHGFTSLCRQRLVLSDGTILYGMRMRHGFTHDR